MKEGYFSKKIVEWYHEYHRDLPWRNTQDAYKIWLSEIILQQTRVAQGLPYFEKFILNYPDVQSLARAKEREVLRLWQGLGYYTRARNLHKCAKVVVQKLRGKFPDSFEELKKLPGIGDYTAAAIASFAYHQRVAVVDGNVYRVLSRVFGIDANVASPEGKRIFTKKANEVISVTDPALHNQAIMEFGALHCTPVNPLCEECVLKKVCIAYKENLQHVLPVKIKQQKITHRHFHYFIIRSEDKILMTERKSKGIWKGLFDFPLHEDAKPAKAARILKKYFPGITVLGNAPHISKDYKHVLSHQVIQARFVTVDLPPGKLIPPSFGKINARWYSLTQIDRLPKPTLITRYIEDYFVH